MIFAIIENGIVVNRVIADEKFIEDNKVEAIDVTDEDVQIGATWDGKVFINPAPIFGRNINDPIEENL